MAENSAPITAPQSPSNPNNIGRIQTQTIGNINERKKDKIADTAPLFKAVKNEEAKILYPDNKKDTE